MSFDGSLPRDLMSTLTSNGEKFDSNHSDLAHVTSTGITLKATDTIGNSSGGVFTTSRTISTTLEKVLRHSIDNSVFGSSATTDDSLDGNNSQTEVIINRPEVLDDSGIGTAEKVVLGAVIIVVALTIVAIILRLCMPYYRRRADKNQTDKSLYVEGPDNNIISGYTNIALDSSSQSSGSHPSSDCFPSTGSNSSSDWSEVSSDQTKSTSFSKESNESESNMADRLHRHPGALPFPGNVKAGSTTSLPLYIQQERSSKSAKASPIQHRKSPNDKRKYTDEMMSVISAKSLEPVRMEDIYRNRWDDQWDPYGSIPRGNLSHHSHPSESRLSLNSFSSHNSSVTFPIPSRKLIHELVKEKERRQLPTVKTAPALLVRTEKHVRMSPPAEHRQPRHPGHLGHPGYLPHPGPSSRK